MPQPPRKNPRLQKKLDTIQREISRMENEIKGISRAVETPDSIEALRRLKQVQGALPAAVPSAKPLEQESDTRFVAPVAQARPNPGVMDESASLQIPKIAPDQRFNTYFGSGSLHSVRPLRQEKRVQRNRAIFMLIVAGLLILLVLKMIF